VPWSDLALHLLALVLYPGALAALAFGVAAEIAAAWALDRVGPRAALRSLLAVSGDAAGRLPGPVLLAALLAVLAATQLAVPFNPVSPVERSLLVAVVALAAASWLGWTPAWSAPAARRQLVVQACWLVALLAPALVAQTHRTRLRPATRRANAAWFGGRLRDVPREALSMGMATILRARRIVLIATGASKAVSVARMVRGPVTPRLPASFLQLHRHAEVWLDRAAAARLKSASGRKGTVG